MEKQKLRAFRTSKEFGVWEPGVGQSQIWEELGALARRAAGTTVV
jgi:hypothetical protein